MRRLVLAGRDIGDQLLLGLRESTLTEMQTRTLGPDRLEVCAVGLGCMGMSQAYGPTDDQQSIETLHAALDSGVTLLDTAMSYGAGANERLLARVLAAAATRSCWRPSSASSVTGRAFTSRPVRSGSAAAWRHRSTASGSRRVDLYYLHRVDPNVPIEDSIGTMSELVAEGRIGHLGVSETTADDLERAVAVHPIAALQIEWSLAWREAEDDVIPTARRLGVGLVPYSPLGRGLLTGGVDVHQLAGDDLRRSDPRFAGEANDRNQAPVTVVAEVGATPGQLALAWLLTQGTDVVPIPGTKRRSWRGPPGPSPVPLRGRRRRRTRPKCPS